MARLTACGEIREIDLVVFDKDGTLVEFDRLWTGKLKAAVDALAMGAEGGVALEAALCATLGMEPASMKVIPESPLAVATLAKLGVAAAVVLHQNGHPWHRAERLVAAHFMPAIEAPPRRQDLVPLGEADRLIRRLKAAGLQVAIFTSDDRLGTEASLATLDLAGVVDATVCGDDAIPGKPSGEGIRHLCRRLGIPAERALMIGDSVADMKAAQDAGAGWRLAVLSGTGAQADLAREAHGVMESVAELRIA